MKYSIRGSIFVSDGTDIINVINKYNLWKLVTGNMKDDITNSDIFIFETWVATETDKTELFNELKSFVDTNSGNIDWHECSHDESNSYPCIITEVYRGK